jgi:hypothetical protein
MRVSVIVTTFDRPANLENALASIALQESVDREVIVVNDGGIDVGGIIARWAPAMPVTYLRLPENRGLSCARNEALRRSQGDVLCFLDDDDVMLAGHLDTGVRELAVGDAEAVYTQVAVCSEFVRPGSSPTAVQVKAHYKAGFDERLLLVCNFVPVNAIFIRRPSTEPLLFDEGLPALEDWELWLRLYRRLGYRFRAVPALSAVYHRVAGFSSMTSRAHRSAEQALRFRDTFRAIAKRYPSTDRRVQEGRALHDQFYAAVAAASRTGSAALAFCYERFVEWMTAFIGGSIDAGEIRRRLDGLAHASRSGGPPGQREPDAATDQGDS